MSLLYVRTGSNGGNAAYLIPDLGFTVPTGASWTLLSASSPSSPSGNSGLFTAREIRDSVDLYAAISGGTLEWSKDGVSEEPTVDYVADYMLFQDFIDDELDLTNGKLILPRAPDLPSSGVSGEIFWDVDNTALYIWSTDAWETIPIGSITHGTLSGLDDDDHPQYHDGSLAFTGNLNMGGNSISGVNLVDGVDVSALYTTVTGLQSDYSAHELDSTIHFTVGSIDHGSISGLGDDDHTRYVDLSGNGTRNAMTGTLNLASGNFILPQATDIGTAFPVAVEGQLAWDTDDEALYAYDGAQWFAIAPASGIITDHGGLTGLLDDDHPQYHNGSLPFTGDLDMGGNDITNVALVDGVDVSGLNSAYTSHAGDSSIHFTEASIDHGSIAGLSDDDHPQYHDGTLPFTGNLNMGGNSISGVNLVDGVDVSALDATVSGHVNDATIHFTEASIDHGSIAGLSDDDHPQYTAWAQDETVSGLWTFNTASGSPAVVLTPHTETPNISDVANGALTIINGVLYVYDATRSTYLSVDRKQLISSRNGKATNLYLRVGADGVASSETGIRMMQNGTITGLFAHTSESATWTFEVRKAGVAIATLSVTAALGAQATNTNVDFSAGDVLQFYVNGTAISYPVAGCEIAWRVDPV